ncbi:hypothetical protein HZA75_04480 [Candidatus Roizmanbacteria bacterium]|nr:hypothetical protein [Candidatus Roizmanbacteria bacterium]
MKIPFFKKINSSAEKNFWKWFSSESKDYLLHLEKRQDELLPKLDKELHKVNANLIYQFSSLKKNGKREFVISVDGQKKLIPAVLKLVAAAPNLDRWEIIAFRQRQHELPIIEIADFKVDPDDIYFSSEIIKNEIHIILFVKNYTAKKEYLGAIFIILDSALGEYDAMTKIDSLEIKLLNETNIHGLKPLKELSKLIDSQKFVN